MRWLGAFFVLLMLSVSFTASVIIESGDNGEQFAKDTVEEQCHGENVQAVYHCFGNVVKVVSSLEGAGSTFYKPDGSVVVCPVAAPSAMGAECVQMLYPNYCPAQAECGASPEEPFVGQNNVTEEEPAVVEPEPEPVVEPVPPAEPYQPSKPAQPPPRNEEEIPAASQNNFDTAFSDLTLIIVLLGVASIVVLFMLFKKSIAE